jgi:hypothetical protein
VIEIVLPKPDAVKQMEIDSMQLMLQSLHEDASLTNSARPADSRIIPQYHISRCWKASLTSVQHVPSSKSTSLVYTKWNLQMQVIITHAFH